MKVDEMNLEAIAIIGKLMSAKSVKDVFPDLANWKVTYKEYFKTIHPDVCNETNANEASNILNRYKMEMEKGKIHSDEACTITYKINTVRMKGDKGLLRLNVDRYKTLMSGKDDKSKAFQKYLPISVTIISDTEIEFTLKERGMPLSSIGTLPEHHVHWILSRLLEFCAYMNDKKYIHGGINPDSIYVCPDNHGIVCISFYHMTPLGKKMKTVCGNYEMFYPSTLFSTKLATTDIDIELSKRTAVYLLGDRSGLGVKLKKTHDSKLLDFLFTRHDEPVETFLEYRKFIKTNFVKKFHILNI